MEIQVIKDELEIAIVVHMYFVQKCVVICEVSYFKVHAWFVFTYTQLGLNK